tara:strand:- start:12060 stop:12749 length:690 start_codon:yes stop_codon:yes gene_type:complete
MSKTLRKEYKTNSKKSLCKSKKEKKCKKIKGCKMTKGKKKTFCRKIRNKKYNKTQKTKGGFTVGQVVNSPMGQEFKKKLEEKVKEKSAEIMSKNIPINEDTLKALTKIDEKKIKAFMEDEKLKDILLSKNKEEAIQRIVKNEKLRKIVINKVKEEVMKNPKMKKLVMEVAKEMLMKGGDDFDRSENTQQVLKNTYSSLDSDKLNEIMMDPKESMESKRAAQQLLMEKYL